MSKAPRHVLPTPPLRDQEAADAARGPGRTGMNSAETAQFIAEFTAELAYLARQTQLDLLAYLLDMARLEAARAMQTDGRKQ